MKHITILLLLLILIAPGCSRVFLTLPSADCNTPITAEGQPAIILAQQVANNMQTEAGRLADLFKYNSILFVILFVVIIGGIIFAVLTKSSWGWIIPTAAGGGLLALVFIVQAAAYIKWIVLGIVVVALGVLVYKCWEYQRERGFGGKDSLTK